MHGNVWEWCEDNYVDNYENTPRDGSAYRDKEKEYFVLRGGSCGNSTNNCRSANRLDDTRILRYDRIGFRVVCGVGRTS
ncbi:MAG: formylglycine-generating enzyme family protein [Microcystaceae cyanobacterium]